MSALPLVAGAVVEPVAANPSQEAAVVVFGSASRPAILESVLQPSAYGRYSIFACDPADEFVFDAAAGGCPIRRLAERAAMYPAMAATSSCPFRGGWIGFLGYEAGLAGTRIAIRAPGNTGLPLSRFCLYDTACVFDHSLHLWQVVAVDWPAGSTIGRTRTPVGARLAAARRRLERAEGLESLPPPPSPTSSSPVSNLSPSEYARLVRKAKRYIDAGDIYQVNLSLRFTVSGVGSPQELYRRLRRSNPSPHAAFLSWDDAAVLSSSPELFLQLRDGHVITRPIKGTRPRGTDRAGDAANRRELIRSEKDASELTMIIDLLRNDLGRVCSPGTIRVTIPCDIEQHPTVFHRVATIEGELAPAMTWADLLRAAFPSGSVTGAPKIRAMQIIDELEPTPRGVYCGAIGMIGLDGFVCLNVAIRTMVQQRDVVHVYAGGAIVADSQPRMEYDEIMAKASGMFQALDVATASRRPISAEVTVA